jgi:hypothetical protein
MRASWLYTCTCYGAISRVKSSWLITLQPPIFQNCTAQDEEDQDLKLMNYEWTYVVIPQFSLLITKARCYLITWMQNIFNILISSLLQTMQCLFCAVAMRGCWPHRLVLCGTVEVANMVGSMSWWTNKTWILWTQAPFRLKCETCCNVKAIVCYFPNLPVGKELTLLWLWSMLKMLWVFGARHLGPNSLSNRYSCKYMVLDDAG